jgi:uncharacterized membrane protein
VILLLLACATGAADSGDTCAGRRDVTWNSWAHGFFFTWCQPCHSATSPDRYGAPEGLDFDTYEQVIALTGSVRQTVLDEGTMPLGGGLTDEDRALLEDFLDCGTGD